MEGLISYFNKLLSDFFYLLKVGSQKRANIVENIFLFAKSTYSCFISLIWKVGSRAESFTFGFTQSLWQLFIRNKKPLTLSWRRSFSYRNQSIGLQSKSMDRFLYDKDDKDHPDERVKECLL